MPLFFGGFGALFCGFISARVARATGSIAFTRRLMACLGFFGAAILLFFSTTVSRCNPRYVPDGHGELLQ